MNPYIDADKLYHRGDTHHDLWDLTPEQLSGLNQLPAVAGTQPDTRHWDNLRRRSELFERDNYEHYQTGRIASHGTST